MPALTVFNTLGRKLEPFASIEPGHARLYTCGPTIYNDVHIGNLRTFVWEDILRRSLKRFGFRVTQVMNLTNVDDKTIRGAADAGMDLREFTEKHAESFFRDLETLGVERAEFYPRATDHVPEMIAIAERLRERGHTYESDGSLWFKISTFPPTAASPESISLRRGRGLASRTTSTKRTTRRISLSGRPRNRGSRRGIRRSAEVGPDGTWSVRRCR